MFDFFWSVVGWAVLLSVTAGLIGLAWIVWRYWLSIKYIGPAFLGIRLLVGKPEGEVNTEGKFIAYVYRSGPGFVPWVPFIKFDGHPVWEMLLVPMGQQPFNFKGMGGEENQEIWSKDHQKLFVDISGYVRFPFNEPDSLGLMVKSGVPMDPQAFHLWMKDEIVSGMRDILANYNHDAVIQRSNLETIRSEAQVFLLKSTGLFARSGICGNDATNFEIGTGEVIIRVDAIRTSKLLQDAMEAEVVQGYLAKAAKEEAKVKQANASVVPQAYADWLKSPEGQTADEDLKKQMLEVIRQRALSADENYQEQVFEVRGPGGKASNLQYLSFGGGGGGAGVLFSGKQKPGRSGGNPGSQSPQGPQGPQGGNPGMPQKGKKLSLEESRKTFREQFGYDPDW